jgi:signal transduction histidine kinase
VERVYDAVLHLHQPFVVYDAQRRLVAWNKAFANLHRESDGSCILRKRMSFDEIAEFRFRTGFYSAAPDDSSVVTSASGLHHRARGGIPYQLRDGRWMYVDRYDLPDGGNVGIWLDITAVKRGEADRLAIEDQLHHAQRLESLGTLAGGIAHDLNNTLVPILGLTKLMMKRLAQDSREHTNLAIIVQAGERARDLVRQILAFSRKEAPTRLSVDFASLVRDSLKMIRASIPATIDIAEAIETVPPVFGDPSQLHQIVINFVVNASHAIGDSMGTISVALTAAVPAAEGNGRAWICLSVRDTGCGMDEATRQRAFEPFFTTKPAGEGTGLGLSVVHGIVVQHGGKIRVESEVGHGTRFDVYLPTIASEEQQQAAEAAQ